MTGTDDNSSGLSDEAEALAAFVSGMVEFWLTGLRTAYDRVTDTEASWEPADLVEESAAAVERAMPMVERSIDLSLRYLQPWSQAFVSRTSNGD